MSENYQPAKKIFAYLTRKNFTASCLQGMGSVWQKCSSVLSKSQVSRRHYVGNREVATPEVEEIIMQDYHKVETQARRAKMGEVYAQCWA